MLKAAFIACGLMLLQACHHTAPDTEHRASANMLRDEFRHPYETLSFFDVRRDHTVVEIWPGAGWYTEILAPMLARHGTYYAAHFDPQSKVKFFRTMRSRFEEKLAADAVHYQHVKLTRFAPPALVDIAPTGSADRVLTFRNVHNWMRNNSEQAAFDAFYKALKPGGILGVVEHRAPQSFTLQQMIDSGYVSESYVIELAQNAGFELLAKSEINANPNDDKQHPDGVWSLPPTLRGGEINKDTYTAIGESDRMTLKFQKPSGQ